MKKSFKFFTYLIGFIVIFTVFYNYLYYYATVNFDIKKVRASHSLCYGQVYYSENNKFNQKNMGAFVHWWGHHKKIQSFSIPIYKKHLNTLRLDPLSDAGEVIVKNITINYVNGFTAHKMPIDLNDINSSLTYNTIVLYKSKNSMYLILTGKDPHLIIANNLQIKFHKLRDFYQIIKITLYSLLTEFLIYFIIIGFIRKKIRVEELLTAFILVSYSIYTVLFGTQFNLANLLLTKYLPILAILIIFKQGIKYYIPAIKNSIFILATMILIIKIIDIIYGIDMFSKYNQTIQYIALSFLIAISFIQKNNFNYQFYKYFLLFLTFVIAVLTILLHYWIIDIDTTIAFGFTMSMSNWAQKNYSIWYLMLLWGTISFFNIKSSDIKDRIAIVILLIISAWSIFSGYSDSVKLGYVASLIVYIVLYWMPFQKKYLKLIPFLLFMYIILFPWISDLFVMLSVKGREALFAIYSDVIKHNLFFGYGFNNLDTVDPEKIVSTDILHKYFHSDFMHSCAPHSSPLFLWLNFGLIGILPFSILLYYSLKKLIDKTYNQFNQAALIALIVAFVSFASFSWGVWQEHSILTSTFFVGIILLSLNTNECKSS